MGRQAIYWEGRVKVAFKRIRRRLFRHPPRGPEFNATNKAQFLELAGDPGSYTFAAANTPFFIVGSVRSGTTILRDLLRLHPRLECPEETHIFRWAEPYGTHSYNLRFKTEVLEDHRDLDGMSTAGFIADLYDCLSREQLFFKYAEKYLSRVGNPQGRIFDKTPQNVYNLLLLTAIYPAAKFIHIHRNPLNVVSSLLQGAQLPKQPLVGAVNYWLESMMLISEFKTLHPEKIFEIRYEELVSDPNRACKAILGFVDEDPDILPDARGLTYEESDNYLRNMSAEEVKIVQAMVRKYAEIYNYA